MKFARVAFAAAMFCSTAARVLAAQSGGPYAPLVLMLPAGTRTLAAGNTGVAGRDDDVLFFNPAQLMVARGTSASIERYSEASGGGSLSSITRLANSAVAIGMRMVEYEPAIIPLNQPAAQATFFPATRRSSILPGDGQGTSVEATIGYARTIKSLRIGVAAKYVNDEVPGVRVGRAAFDVGFAKDLFRNYTFALSVQNIGEGMSVPCPTAPGPDGNPCVILPLLPGSTPSQTATVHLPLRSTLGVAQSRQLGEFDLIWTAAASMLRKNFFIPSGGAELSYSWISGYNVALRAGARRPLPGEEALTGGAGLTADRLSIDYAFEALKFGRVGHRFGLRVR